MTGERLAAAREGVGRARIQQGSAPPPEPAGTNRVCGAAYASSGGAPQPGGWAKKTAPGHGAGMGGRVVRDRERGMARPADRRAGAVARAAAAEVRREILDRAVERVEAEPGVALVVVLEEDAAAVGRPLGIVDVAVEL